MVLVTEIILFPRNSYDWETNIFKVGCQIATLTLQFCSVHSEPSVSGELKEHEEVRKNSSGFPYFVVFPVIFQNG